MHQILITRPAGRYRDAVRRYRIEVDGSKVGTSGAGEELAVPAVEGAHVVQALNGATGLRQAGQVSIAATSPRRLRTPTFSNTALR
jgi:hypothetical protein